MVPELYIHSGQTKCKAISDSTINQQYWHTWQVDQTVLMALESNQYQDWSEIQQAVCYCDRPHDSTTQTAKI